MFNKGKSNQENSKRNGWNGSSGRFRDPVVERIPCLWEEERKGVRNSIGSLLS